jgi:hypothetical protein
MPLSSSYEDVVIGDDTEKLDFDVIYSVKVVDEYVV